jgi:hypothetical protein
MRRLVGPQALVNLWGLSVARYRSLAGRSTFGKPDILRGAGAGMKVDRKPPWRSTVYRME